MKLKAGYGYYDLKYYPIGGSFHRAGSLGIDIDTVKKLTLSCHGCTATAIRTDTQTEIAFNLNHCEE